MHVLPQINGTTTPFLRNTCGIVFLPTSMFLAPLFWYSLTCHLPHLNERTFKWALSVGYIEVPIPIWFVTPMQFLTMTGSGMCRLSVGVNSTFLISALQGTHAFKS